MAENGLEPSAESLGESESGDRLVLKTVEPDHDVEADVAAVRESPSPLENGCKDPNADELAATGDDESEVKEKAVVVKKRSSTKKMMEKALYLCDEDDDDEPPEKLSFEGTTPEVGGRAKWLERQRDRETKNKRLSKTKDGTFFSYMFLEKIFRESRKCKLCGAKDSGKPQTDDETSLELYLSERGVCGRQRLICSTCDGVFPVISCESEAEIPDKPEYQIDGSTVRYYCKKAMHFGVLHDLMELLNIAALESDKSRKQKHFELAEFMLYNARKVCKEWCRPENSELRNKRFLRLREDTLLIRHKPIFTIDHNAEYKEMYGMMAGSFRQHREKVKLLLELMRTTLFDNPTQSSFFLWVAIAMIHAESYQKFKERYDPRSYMQIDSTEYQALKDRYLALHVALGIKKIPICFVLFELPRFYHFIDFLKERIGRERPTSYLTVEDQRTLEKFDRQAHKYMMKRKQKSGKLVSVESHLDMLMHQEEIDRELMFRNTKEKERAKAEDKKRQRKLRREERQRRAVAVKELQDNNRVSSDGKIVEEISESLGDLERKRQERKARMPYPPFRQRVLGPIRERTSLEKDMVADMTLRKPYKSRFDLLLEEEDRQWGLDGNWSRKDILLCEEDMMFERRVCIRFKKPEKSYSETIPASIHLPPPGGRMPTQAEVQLLMDDLLAQEMDPISFDGACSTVTESQMKRWKNEESSPADKKGEEKEEEEEVKSEEQKTEGGEGNKEKEGGGVKEVEREGTEINLEKEEKNSGSDGSKAKEAAEVAAENSELDQKQPEGAVEPKESESVSEEKSNGQQPSPSDVSSDSTSAVGESKLPEENGTTKSSHAAAVEEGEIGASPAEEKVERSKPIVENKEEEEGEVGAELQEEQKDTKPAENHKPTEQEEDAAQTAEKGKDDEKDSNADKQVSEGDESESEQGDMLYGSGTDNESEESEGDHSLLSDDDEEEEEDGECDSEPDSKEREDEEEARERIDREILRDMHPEIHEALREMEEREMIRKKALESLSKEEKEKLGIYEQTSVNEPEIDQPITFSVSENLPSQPPPPTPAPANCSSEPQNIEPATGEPATSEPATGEPPTDEHTATEKTEVESVPESADSPTTSNSHPDLAESLARERLIAEEAKKEEKVEAVEDEKPAREESQRERKISKKKSKKMEKKAKKLVEAVQRRKAIEEKYFQHRLLKRTPSEEAFEKLMEKKDCTLAELTPEEKQVLMDHCHRKKRRDPIDEEWDRTMFSSRRKVKGPAFVRSRLRQKLHDRKRDDDHLYSRAYRMRDESPERPKTPEYNTHPKSSDPPKAKRKSKRAKTAGKESVNGGKEVPVPDTEKMVEVKEKLDKIGMNASMPKTEPMKSKVTDSKEKETTEEKSAAANQKPLEIAETSSQPVDPQRDQEGGESRLFTPDEFHDLLVDHLKANEEAEKSETPPTPPQIPAKIAGGNGKEVDPTSSGESEKQPDPTHASSEDAEQPVEEKKLSRLEDESGRKEETGEGDEKLSKVEEDKEAERREKRRRRRLEKKKANKLKKEEEQLAAIAEQEKAKLEQEKAKIELEKAKAELERVKAEQDIELRGKVDSKPEPAKTSTNPSESPLEGKLVFHKRKKPKNPDFNPKDYTTDQPIEMLGAIPLMLTKAPSYIILEDMEAAEADKDEDNSSPGCFIYKTSVENGGKDHPFHDIFLFARKRQEDLDVIVEVSPIKASRNHEDVLCLAGKPGRVSYSCKLEVSQLCTPVGESIPSTILVYNCLI